MHLSFGVALPLALSLLSLSPSVTASPEPHLLDTLQTWYDHLVSKSHRILGAAGSTCPAPSFLPLSCSNGASPEGVNGCCTNTPGGYFLSTQFWDTNPPTGPNDSFTLHGLWPDNCDGTYQANCDPSRFYPDIRGKLEQYGPADLVPFMNKYWKDYQGNDESFWEHEWNKHGTCISTLNTTCYGASYTPYEELVDYFVRATDLFKSLPTFDWLASAGIVPSTTKTYTLAQLQQVAKSKFGYEAIWNCQNGELNEVWYGYYSKGPIKGGMLIPTNPDGAKSTCPSTGIKFLPKGTTSTSTSTGSASTPTNTGGSSSSGSVFMNVVANGSQNGCLISNGKWYTTGTCAGYSVVSTSNGDEFTLKTSKGPCTVSSGGDLSCASGNSASTFSKDSNGYLTYASSSSFYAAQVATGQNQVVVSTATGAVPLKIVVAPQ
ncbi:hypothetical protein JCM10212_000787 [Sporobolomyces blumeae]